jgi:hypothetical protein
VAHVCLEERTPRHLLLPCGCRLDPFPLQDALDGRSAYAMPRTM